MPLWIIPMVAANVAAHYALSEAVTSKIANLAVFDTWGIVLLIWAGISVVLAIGFVLIVPITAARDLEKRSGKDRADQL